MANAPVRLIRGCVFAKSCALPDGLMDFNNYNDFVPVEALTQYGAYAVLGTTAKASHAGTPLQWIGGSTSARIFGARLQGTLSATAPPHTNVIVTVLMPSTNSGDSAFYRAEQYAHLTDGNTRVRLNVKRLSDGSVSAYGFYTGTQSQWQRVPVIAAQARGDQQVADMGRGIEVIWTPAADPASVMSIPALEGVTLNPTAWVFPPTEQANKILVNPVHPPDYQDAIVWFPEHPHRAPFYLSINTRMLKREDDPSA